MKLTKEILKELVAEGCDWEGAFSKCFHWYDQDKVISIVSYCPTKQYLSDNSVHENITFDLHEGNWGCNDDGKLIIFDPFA